MLLVLAVRTRHAALAMERPPLADKLTGTVEADETYIGDAHSNTVEGFFSLLKLSINGTYHHISERRLDRYLAEFDYRLRLQSVSLNHCG